jgi:hypothetical protein
MQETRLLVSEKSRFASRPFKYSCAGSEGASVASERGNCYVESLLLSEIEASRCFQFRTRFDQQTDAIEPYWRKLGIIISVRGYAKHRYHDKYLYFTIIILIRILTSF